jgi:hypothetical protein
LTVFHVIINACLTFFSFLVLSFHYFPPSLPSSLTSLQWEDEVKDMMSSIGKMSIGGPVLREYIHKEVRRLQALRFTLFCMYM